MAKLDDSDLHQRLEWLRQMKRIRAFEKELAVQYDKKNVRGTLHLCVGQEAIAVGVCSTMEAGDFVTSTHRGHGHFLAAGGEPKRMMAELFGRRDGYCQGKGGTQHMAHMECGFLGSNGITGGGIPYATGMALAQKMSANHKVVVCFFGDGASNQGTFHEALNMAAIWKLPILYVLENNQYAMGSAVDSMSATPSLSVRSIAYGIPGLEVDGNDVLAVHRVARKALERVRGGGGPVLLEAHTYRMVGHSRSDRCQYRTRLEESEWSAKCPIELFQRVLRKQGLEDAVFATIDDAIAAEMNVAVEFAAASGHLKKDELLANVYCE